MLTEVWRELVNTLQPVTTRKSEQEHRLELVTGGTVDMWSLDQPDTARGRPYARVIVDEAAMVPSLQDAWQQVIRPTLADYQGDAWFLSTPKGLNYFWQLFSLAVDSEHWAAWRFPTSANPFIAATEIEAARRELPERVFAQEYLAEFIADEGAVFRGVSAAATLEPAEYDPKHAYVIGADWGKSNDFSVFAVLDATAKSLTYLDRSNQLAYTVQAERIAHLAKRYHASVVAETNSMGMAVIDMLRRLGIRVFNWTATNASKVAMIEHLELGIEQGQLRLLRNPVLIGELQAYQAERLPSGAIRYAAPEGMHDDCVIALGLAWLGASHDSRQPQQHDFAVVP